MVVDIGDICRLTGLSGVEAKNVVKFLKEKGVDWQDVPDWRTIGEDIADYSDKYAAVWDKLIEHGVVVERPLPVSQIGRREELWKMEEEEWLLGTKEGFKELLKRIYKNGLSKKEEERLKEKLLNRPELATLIALYNGKERDYARRYLAEMVVAPTREDVKELLKADKLKIHSSRGWIRSVNDIPLKKPLKSIDLVEYIADYDLIASQKADDGTVAVYSKKPVLKPVEPVGEIAPKREEIVVEAEIEPSVAKIDELSVKYSYAEIAKMAKDSNIRLSNKFKMLSELIRLDVV